MKFADYLKSHPTKARAARTLLRMAVADGADLKAIRKEVFADSLDYNAGIPVITAFIADKIGKGIVRGLMDEPAEMAKVEEDADPLAPPLEDAAAPMGKKAMADAVAQGVATALAADRAERAAIDARLKLIETERASRLAAADADALATRARETASALDNAAVPRPAGFDPANPTAAMCDAADVALRRGLAAPRQHFGALSTAGKRWGGDGRRLDIQAAADGDTETTLADLDA